MSDDTQSSAPPPPPEGGSAGAGAPPPPPSGGSAGPGGPAPPPPPSGGAGGPVSPNRQVMIVLSYLGILALIPYLAEQEDPEVRWHCRNGLSLFVAEIVAVIVLWIVSLILSAIPGVGPFLGCAFAILFVFLGLAILAYHIFLIVKATGGERIRIPTVSDYAERIP